jgi:hypothetical protein
VGVRCDEARAGRTTRVDFFEGERAAEGLTAAFVRGAEDLAPDCSARTSWPLVNPFTPGMRRCFASFSSASRESAVSGGVGIEGVSQRSSTGVRRLAHAKRSDVKKRLVSLVMLVHQRPAEGVIREPVSRF